MGNGVGRVHKLDKYNRQQSVFTNTTLKKIYPILIFMIVIMKTLMQEVNNKQPQRPILYQSMMKMMYSASFWRIFFKQGQRTTVFGSLFPLSMLVYLFLVCLEGSMVQNDSQSLECLPITDNEAMESNIRSKNDHFSFMILLLFILLYIVIVSILNHKYIIHLR